jgi:hypothetical protein
MQPIEGDLRRIIAAERMERLRLDAERRCTTRGRSPKAWLGDALIAAGVRLSRGAAAPPAPDCVRAARPW